MRKPLPGKDVLRTLSAQTIQGGYDLSADYPELGGDAVLICATEKRTRAEMERFREKLERLVQMQGMKSCGAMPDA